MTNANKPYNILIVDDVPNNIKIMANILDCEDYKLFFATNGCNALEKIRNTPFDLILLDIMMPGMDGFEVCQHVKQNSETSAKKKLCTMYGATPLISPRVWSQPVRLAGSISPEAPIFW